jgi:hypothetical protein
LAKISGPGLVNAFAVADLDALPNIMPRGPTAWSRMPLRTPVESDGMRLPQDPFSEAIAIQTI